MIRAAPPPDDPPPLVAVGGVVPFPPPSKPSVFANANGGKYASGARYRRLGFAFCICEPGLSTIPPGSS
eukprot:8022581-Alexandrium_andersonii.AAC.1